MADNEAPLTLRILTPDGAAAETRCAGVILTVRDGADGKGGGLLGIRKGHTPAVFALAPGRIEASAGGKLVLSLRTAGGFASVGGDLVTVITDAVQREQT